MESNIALCLARFRSISLDELNTKAAMLERIDRKYIMSAADLRQALAAMADQFDILTIQDKRSFSYSTRYFDDAERHCYYDHHQQRRKRYKARVRHYLDADSSYLEVKLKEHRSMTAKRRLQVAGPVNCLDNRCQAFVRDCYREAYHAELHLQLEPVVIVEYERVTLVARVGGERMTIDTALRFYSSSCNCVTRSDLFIVETKASCLNGIADSKFRSLHLKPTPRVSKFCIGMVVTGQVARYNGFLPALRKLDLVSSRRTTPHVIPLPVPSASIDFIADLAVARG
jgi:VTC domain